MSNFPLTFTGDSLSSGNTIQGIQVFTVMVHPICVRKTCNIALNQTGLPVMSLTTVPHLDAIRPYTPMRGALSTVWFDRNKITPDCPEHRESIDGMCNTLGSIIQDEVNAGIPKHRMLIGMDLILTSCLLHVQIGTFIIGSFGALFKNTPTVPTPPMLTN